MERLFRVSRSSFRHVSGSPCGMEERSETTRESERRGDQVKDTRSPGLERSAADSKDERDPKEQQTDELRRRGDLKGD